MSDIPQTSAEWAEHFERNLEVLLPMPWEQAATWSDEEKASLGPSLQEFQLGETSDGSRLMARAEQYAAETGDGDYVEAMQLFVREEQRHSRLLGSFLTQAGMELRLSTWLDRAFRKLRRWSGLEFAIMTLTTAEIVGTVYYRSLRDATRCLLLRRICQQLLRDELMHLRFHAQRLARIRMGHAKWRVAGRMLLHRFLVGIAGVLVWFRHRSAFRAGRYTFLRCARREWRAECAKFQKEATPRAMEEKREPSMAWGKVMWMRSECSKGLSIPLTRTLGNSPLAHRWNARTIVSPAGEKVIISACRGR
ncbi:MAG: ferritin-like domain-containing protein [Gemmataceae bacterium]